MLGIASFFDLWVQKVGSAITGPHFVSSLWRHMWISYGQTLFQTCVLKALLKSLVLPAERRRTKKTKENVDQLLTQQRAKCGPIVDPTKGKMWTNYWPYNVYIHISMHAVKLLSGPSLAILDVIIWAKWVLLSGPSLFFSLFYSVSSDVCTLNYHWFWGTNYQANF